MKKTFIFYHWGLTLIFSPLVSWFFETGGIDELFKNYLYLIIIIISIIFSLPTLLVNAIIFYLLTKNSVDFISSKLLLILTTIIGIVLTFYFVSDYGRKTDINIIMGYVILSIIFGLSVKLDKVEINDKESF